MTELRIPIGRHARRIFWTVVVGAVTLLIVARFLVVPHLSGEPIPSVTQVVNESLGNILATVIAATVLSTVVVWLTRPAKRPTDLLVIHPKDISPTLERNLGEARSWWYSGTTGRWNRARVVPELAARAKSLGSSCEVILSILDPREESICSVYGAYRSSVRTGSSNTWSLTDVQRELYATILVAAEFDQSTLLTVKVNLRQATSIFRVDSSEVALVATREDPKEPALVCEQGTYFFDAFRQDMIFERSQGTDLVFDDVSIDLATLDVPGARALLAKLGFSTPDLDDDDKIAAILQEARKRDNPY